MSTPKVYCPFTKENDEYTTFCCDRPRPVAKSVTFADRCRVRLTAPKTEEDRVHTWYNQADYISFKKDCLRSLKILLQHEDVAVDMVSGDESSSSMITNETWIGLDQYLPRRTHLRTQRRLFVWDLVLESQDNMESKTLDPAWTEEQCFIVSEESTLDAHRSAVILARHLGVVDITGDAGCIAKCKKSSLTSKSVLVSSPRRPFVKKAEKRVVISPMA